jgi:DNA-binding NtrC family response regulator
MKSKNILILEDDEITVKLYKKNLEEFTLHIASNFREAITLIEGNNPFDLYILDMVLKQSKFNGNMLIPFCGNKPIIICTALNLKFAITEKHENVEYIQKPLRNDQFKAKVKKLLCIE